MTTAEKLIKGNHNYMIQGNSSLREDTALNGQHPYAIVICCSDSRVIPEQIFSASIGELFVIRVAGNVLDKQQLGSIEYAAGHLGCKLILLLGHTHCGAVDAALSGHGHGFIRYITDEIQGAIGDELNPDNACRLNVQHGIAKIKAAFENHPEMSDVEIKGAVYDILSGEVEWLE